MFKKVFSCIHVCQKMWLNKSFYLTFIICLLSRLTVVKSDPVSSYYNNLRLVSTSQGIAIQMNNSILHIWRMDYYAYNQRMYLSLPNDDCRIKISYGNYIVNSKLNRYICTEYGTYRDGNSIKIKHLLMIL